MDVLTYIWKHKSLLILIILYSVLSLSFIIGNGNYSCAQGVCGLHIGGWHLHDAMWHLALVKTSFNQFPFIHPEMSGAYLNGYNYFLDIVIFGLTKLGFPALFLFFKLLPILFIPAYTYLIVLFGLRYNKSIKYIWSLLFFMFLGSSFTYLIPLYKDHSLYYAALKGFPVVTSIQPGLIFLNLQFAYSLLCILGIMLLLVKDRTWVRNLIIGILVFVSASLKFYGGAVAISLVGFYEFFSFFKHKNILIFVKNIIFSLILLVLSILMFYKTSGVEVKSPFVYVPFALTHQMIEDPLLFFNESMTNARYFLYEHGISPRLIAIEAYSIILFLLVNFGTRLIFLVTLPMQIIRSKLSQLQVVMLITILITTLIPLLFVQDGGWFNTMQFLYYGVFLSSFFAADTLTLLLQNKKNMATLLVGLVILLTIPNDIEQVRYIYEPQKVIPSGELEALDFLSRQPKGSVYTTYSYKKTAYISALSGQQTYFVDVDQLMVTHIDYKSREEVVLWPNLIDPSTVDAKYWYLVRAEEDYQVYMDKIKYSHDFVEIFSNGAVTIYRNDNIL